MAAPVLQALASLEQFTSLSEQLLVTAIAAVLIALLITLRR
jgi:uncharacterized membrane protein